MFYNKILKIFSYNEKNEKLKSKNIYLFFISHLSLSKIFSSLINSLENKNVVFLYMERFLETE